MEIIKWACQKCHKIFYTEGLGGDKPICQCSWNSDVRLVWIDMKPTKRVWDEIRESGSSLKRKKTTKEDVWRFTANLYTTEDETEEDILKKLPF